MVTKTNVFFQIAAALAALALITTPASADEAAEQFIQNVLDEATPILSESDETKLYDGLAVLVDKHVDMRRVGLFTLGQYARQLTAEQKEAYFPLFKKYATLVYQSSLSNYTGQILAVTGSIDRSERDIIVTSEIVDAQPGDPFADFIIHWRVYRNRDGDMSVVDAGANDIWLAIEQRSQFTSVIANNGGGSQGIDALIVQLREQVGD